MTDDWPLLEGTEANWRADLRAPLPDWKTSERVEWLRLHRIEQGDRCHYCTCAFMCPIDEPMLKPTLDHVVTLSKGGEHSFENTVAACWLCNTAKQSMMPDEAATRLPHVRVALLNAILHKRKRLKRRRKDQRKRARLREAKRLAAEATAAGALQVTPVDHAAGSDES